MTTEDTPDNVFQFKAPANDVKGEPDGTTYTARELLEAALVDADALEHLVMVAVTKDGYCAVGHTDTSEALLTWMNFKFQKKLMGHV